VPKEYYFDREISDILYVTDIAPFPQHSLPLLFYAFTNCIKLELTFQKEKNLFLESLGVICGS